VQALAAIGAAQGGGEVESLYAAAALANEGSLSGPLLNLREAATELIVFEDSAGGIRAVKRAADLLRAAGCAVRVQGIGIATEASKQAALEGVADWIAPSINEALEAVLSG
jgi:hypothetical protein